MNLPALTSRNPELSGPSEQAAGFVLASTYKDTESYKNRGSGAITTSTVRSLESKFSPFLEGWPERMEFPLYSHTGKKVEECALRDILQPFPYIGSLPWPWFWNESLERIPPPNFENPLYMCLPHRWECASVPQAENQGEDLQRKPMFKSHSSLSTLFCTWMPQPWISSYVQQWLYFLSKVKSLLSALWHEATPVQRPTWLVPTHKHRNMILYSSSVFFSWLKWPNETKGEVNRIKNTSLLCLTLDKIYL